MRRLLTVASTVTVLALAAAILPASAAPLAPGIIFGSTGAAAELVRQAHSRRRYHCHRRTSRTCRWTRGRRGRVRVCDPSTIEDCHGGYSSFRGGRRVITIDS